MRPATEYMISGPLNATRLRTPPKKRLNQSLPWWWFLFSHPHLLFVEITGSDIAASKKHSKHVISQPAYATRAWKVRSVRRQFCEDQREPHSSLTGEGLCVIVQSGEEARRNKLSIKYIYSNLTPSNLKTCGLTVYKELHPTRDSDKLAKEAQGKCQGNSATCHLPGESYELSLVILICQQAWENPVGWNSPEDTRLG